jgi:hypothetical protein
VSVLLYLGSPQLMIAAASMLSHTSCLFALAWLTLLVLRTRGQHPRLALDAGVALCFGVALFVRPLTAVGFGVPLLVLWAAGVRRRSSRRTVALVAFGVPALGLASLFLLVNALQNGSPFRVAYQAVCEYQALNGFRFTTLTPGDAARSIPLHLGELARGLSLTAAALLRLNGALFGWPCSLLFVVAVGWQREIRFLWGIVGCYFASHLFAPSVGIDSFGPVKYLELSLALIWLTVAGLRRWTLFLASTPKLRRWAPLPVSAMVVSLGLAILVYLPVRGRALHMMSSRVRAIWDAPARMGLRRAVVFAPVPIWQHCRLPPRSWVLFRPTNHPSLVGPVLWVNRLKPAENRSFMRSFPDRSGHVLFWDRRCRLGIVPLELVEENRAD